MAQKGYMTTIGTGGAFTDPDYPDPSNVEKDIVYADGGGKDAITGTLVVTTPASEAGVGDALSIGTHGWWVNAYGAGVGPPPNTPTIAGSPGADGVSIDITVAGDDNALNVVYYKRLIDQTWIKHGSRTDDGAYTIDGLAQRTKYDVIVQSFTSDGGNSVMSNELSITTRVVDEGEPIINQLPSYRHWWFDWETKGFWPVTFGDTDHQPTAAHFYKAHLVHRAAVVLGTLDGYVRRFHEANETDEGTEIDSYVIIDPIHMGFDEDIYGLVSELNVALGEASGDVDWDVLVAETFEGIRDAEAFMSGTFESHTLTAMNYTIRPRARGIAFSIKMQNGEADRAWSFEKASARFVEAGKQRLR